MLTTVEHSHILHLKDIFLLGFDRNPILHVILPYGFEFYADFSSCISGSCKCILQRKKYIE